MRGGRGVHQEPVLGPERRLSRQHVADGALQAYVVISKNANVATGAGGLADAEEIVRVVGTGVGCRPEDVLIASTGVIGRRYPMEKIRAHIAHARRPASRSPRPSRLPASDHDHRHVPEGRVRDAEVEPRS